MTYHQNRDPEVATELFEESQKELEDENEEEEHIFLVPKSAEDKFIELLTK